MHYYSKITGGFYNPEINTSMPSDAVEVSDENYQALLLAQCEGRIIQGDINGNPVAVTPTLTDAQQAVANAGAAIAAGVIITSTATPSLNGIYAIDPVTQIKLNSGITYIMVTGAFPPASALSMPWYDTDGAAHIFTKVSDFKNFATALADFIAHVDIYASSGGLTGSIPSDTITIP